MLKSSLVVGNFLAYRQHLPIHSKRDRQSMPKVIRTLTFGAVALLSVSAVASETASHAQTRLLAAACANCHGTDGKLGGAIPAIAGRPASVLERQLLAFKQGQVPGATIMDRISRGYSDEELRQLAQHFSRITR